MTPMDCKQIEVEGVIEQYVANRLPNSMRKTFELHYFGCDRCFEALKAYRTVAIAMKTPSAMTKIRRAPRWLWPAAIAASAAIAMVGIRSYRHATEAPPKMEASTLPDLALLARVQPPAYAPPTMRAIPDAATRGFQTAMVPYQQRNYRAAIESLRGFLGASQSGEHSYRDAEFFLGACYLLTNQADNAREMLGTVLSEDSPYREEAHFLLAQAWLEKHDTVQAIGELETVASMKGDLRHAAERQLAQIRAAQSKSP